MSLGELSWLAVAAYTAHILEEAFCDWRGWVRGLSGIMVSWLQFWSVNALAVVLGIICAVFAVKYPVLALSYAALMLINATFFHVGGFIKGRGRYSPGLITAIGLFYPLGFSCYKTAYTSGLLTYTNLVASIVLGVFYMAIPVI